MMMKIKYFVCGGFEHIIHNCRNVEKRQEKEPIQRSLNKFELFKDSVMNIGENSGRKIKKDRKIVLREERAKKEKLVEVQKTGVEDNDNRIEKKGELLREVTVKIWLKQKDDDERIVMEALLNSSTTGLMMSLEFARKNKFKMRKLERPIYMRNINNTFNYEGPIKYTVEVELFFKRHKERTLIDVI